MRLWSNLLFLFSFFIIPGVAFSEKKEEKKEEKKPSRSLIDLNAKQKEKWEQSWKKTPRYYIVQKGDTLSDISKRFLGNSWFWPKVWSNNPHIQNPHWIFPGNRVDFSQTGEIQTGQKTSWGDVSSSQIGSRTSSSDVTFSNKNGSIFKDLNNISQDVLSFRRETYIESKKVQSYGTIQHGPIVRSIYGTGDLVFLHFKSLKNIVVGDEYSIFRKLQAIIDPKTNKISGNKIELYGHVRIQRLVKKKALAVVTRTFREIETGYIIGAYTPHIIKIRKRRNESLVKGYILQASDGERLYGRFFQLFINRGRRHGLFPGNTITIYKRGDIEREFLSIPQKQKYIRQKIGEAILIEVRLKTSLAVITKSLTEIYRGDEIETSLEN